MEANNDLFLNKKCNFQCKKQKQAWLQQVLINNHTITQAPIVWVFFSAILSSIFVILYLFVVWVLLLHGATPTPTIWMQFDHVPSYVVIFFHFFALIFLPSLVLRCCAPLCSRLGVDMFHRVIIVMSCPCEDVQMQPNPYGPAANSMDFDKISQHP